MNHEIIAYFCPLSWIAPRLIRIIFYVRSWNQHSKCPQQFDTITCTSSRETFPAVYFVSSYKSDSHSEICCVVSSLHLRNHMPLSWILLIFREHIWESRGGYIQVQHRQPPCSPINTNNTWQYRQLTTSCAAHWDTNQPSCWYLNSFTFTNLWTSNLMYGRVKLSVTLKTNGLNGTVTTQEKKKAPAKPDEIKILT